MPIILMLGNPGGWGGMVGCQGYTARTILKWYNPSLFKEQQQQQQTPTKKQERANRDMKLKCYEWKVRIAILAPLRLRASYIV